MRVALFCQSLLSDWNHGNNAQFLRGVVSELDRRGHRVEVYEPIDAWSAMNRARSAKDKGEEEALRVVSATYPNIQPVRFSLDAFDVDRALDGVDLVVVHEWIAPALVKAIGLRRTRGGRFRLLFHDTHHRSVTDPDALERCDLSGYDGVLAFGRAVKEAYERHGSRRVWVWHEAADTRVLRPAPTATSRDGDVVWLGNWGDDDRSAELDEYLVEPVHALQLKATVHGVRLSSGVLDKLAVCGVRDGGWLPSLRVPEVLARYPLTVHVPRRTYAEALPGIPTSRVFEALACGVPLITACWTDTEGLFTPGRDFLMVDSGEGMRRAMQTLLNDPGAAEELARHGRETILERHTCAHRVDELLAIARSLGLRDGRASVPPSSASPTMSSPSSRSTSPAWRQ